MLIIQSPETNNRLTRLDNKIKSPVLIDKFYPLYPLLIYEVNGDKDV